MTTAKNALIEEAEKLFKVGKHDKAIKQYQMVLASDPKDQRARLRLAEIFSKKKDIPSAVKTLLEVAQAYVAGKFQLKAIAVYKNILKLNPSAVEANENLARLYADMGMADDAVHQYQIVATYYETKGEQSKAVESRRRIAALCPEEVTGRIRLAEVLQREGKDDEAVREYDAVAALARKQKNKKLLMEIFEKLTNRRPERIAEAKELIRMYLEQEEWDRAGRKIGQLGTVVEKDAELLEFQILLMERQDQWEPAKDKYRALVGLLVGTGDKKKISEIKKQVASKYAEDAEFLKELEALSRLS